jgi:uncharacterized membrane protein YdjX (TVP38/TMEM64 family)
VPAREYELTRGLETMERLLKWIDEFEDLLAIARLQAGPVVVTLLLLAVFVATVGAVFLFGPPELLAAP